MLPDTTETLIAAEELVKRNFEVWAYTSDDFIVAQRLEQVGCVAVMPLGSPIGSGSRYPQSTRVGAHYRASQRSRAPRRRRRHRLGRGVGHGARLRRGVLIASAMNRALEPVLMAEALRDAVRAGYLAHLAGRIPTRLHAEASSPALGRPDLFA